MSDVTLGMWLALERIDPQGEERADLRAGIIASTIANWAGKSLRDGAKQLTPVLFMPYTQSNDRYDDQRVSRDIRAFFMSRSE